MTNLNGRLTLNFFLNLKQLCLVLALMLLLNVTFMATASIAAPLTNQEWFAKSKYGIFVHYLPRAGADPIPAAPDGTWNNTVENFNVAQFVSDVKKTGAAYVVFTVGANTAYYVSPNKVLTDKIGVQPGQYTPIKRDLILDLSAALKEIDVKLLVYAAVLGPIAEPEISIRANFPSGDDSGSAPTRETVRNVLAQYSKQWGDNIAGWWLDGCFGKTGYGDPIEGEKNVDDLLKAVRVGNTSALAACNPSVQLFTSLSKEQDYVAGEEQRFHRFPNADTPQFKGKALIWHVLSYLGENWGDGSVYYTPEHMARYIQRVSDRAGVVTVDVGIRADGSLYPEQLAVMEKVKAVNRAPNLALNKPARFVSNTSSSPSDPDLPVNGDRYTHLANYAVDGVKNDRDAQASIEYAWSLEVDLTSSSTFSRAAVTFPADRYATDFELLVSNDRLSWQSLKNIKVTAGGTYSIEFPKVTARYARLRANSPNDFGQQGNQMAISEFEIFDDPLPPDPNLAKYKTVRFINGAGNSELPWNGAVYEQFAMYAVDGLKSGADDALYGIKGMRGDRVATASLEYTWSLAVDLDQPTAFNRAVVTFPIGAFATNFDIQVSDDQQRWRTVKQMEISAGGDYTLEFPTVTARYVRVKANKPDGPIPPNTNGPATTGMSIKEFELYNDYRNDSRPM